MGDPRARVVVVDAASPAPARQAVLRSVVSEMHSCSPSPGGTTRAYAYVVDRKKDMVISGGMSIYPGEVE